MLYSCNYQMKTLIKLFLTLTFYNTIPKAERFIRKTKLISYTSAEVSFWEAQGPGVCVSWGLLTLRQGQKQKDKKV